MMKKSFLKILSLKGNFFFLSEVVRSFGSISVSGLDAFTLIDSQNC